MNLLDPEIDLAKTAPPAPGQPRTVFPSAYQLTADQEKGMIEHALTRLRETEEELGRDIVGQKDWCGSGSHDQVNAGVKTFLGRRQIFEMMYENEVEWRALVEGGIYAESNWTVPISRRVVSHQVARANAHFVGTDPWFSADVERPGLDPETRHQAERWLRSKMREARLKSVIEQAIERAFVRGESVIKRVHRHRADIYQAELELMVDIRTGEPVLDSRGEYVTRQRRVVVEQAQPAAPSIEKPLGTVLPVPAQMRLVLEDDPATAIPDEPDRRWEKRVVPRRNVLYNGPHAELCYYKDILIPLDAANVDDAGEVFHCYDILVADLADAWKRRGEGIGEEAANLDTANAVAAIMAMRGNGPSGIESSTTDERRGAGSNYRDERPEDRTANDSRRLSRDGSASAKIVECWMRYDFNGDGIAENVLLVLDRETETPIHYDYVSNITPDGRRPFSVLRINPVDGRWYGIGGMQVFEQIQRICDLLVNRWHFNNGQSGRITFVNRSLIVGATLDNDFELNWGETYELEEGGKAEDAVSYINLPEMKGADLKQLMDFYLQFAFNMTGVQTANDAQMAGLASAKNATSIINIDKAGHELFGALLSHIEDGLGPAMDAIAELAVANMAETENYQWLEGDRMEFGLFERSVIGDSRLRLRLLLTKFKAEQEKVAIAAAIDRAVEFYGLPPAAQVALASLYQQFLRVNEIAGVEELIVPLPDPAAMGMPPGQPAAPMQPGPTGAMEGATTYPAGDPGVAPSLDRYAGSIAGGIKGGIGAAA